MKIITINLYSITGEHLIPMLQLECHQFLYLTHEAKLLPTKEFLQIQREIKSELDNLYGEDPSSYPKYNPDGYRELAHLCSLKITEE